MLLLSVIIVSYNTKDLILQCIDSLYKQKQMPGTLEIIVVDNASGDGSVQAIRDVYPKVKIVANKVNAGFSKANNQGVAKAKGPFVLFLNPDTVVYPYTISTMLTFMDQHPECGMATCRLEMPNGKIDDASHRGFPTPWNSFSHFSGLARLFPKTRLFGGYNMGYMDIHKTHEVDAIAGACMFVRRDAGDAVGWWDEDYFWYGEDLEFCYQIKKKGWKIYYVPDVSILHYKGVSGGLKSVSKDISTADKETKLRATRARFEAMRIFYRKHYLQTYPPLLTTLVFQGITLLEWAATKKYSR